MRTITKVLAIVIAAVYIGITAGTNAIDAMHKAQAMQMQRANAAENK